MHEPTTGKTKETRLLKIARSPDAALVEAIGRIRQGDDPQVVLAEIPLIGVKGLPPDQAAKVLREMAFDRDAPMGQYFAKVEARHARRHKTLLVHGLFLAWIGLFGWLAWHSLFQLSQSAF